MRTLTVGHKTVELETAIAEALEREDILYSCGVNHDLHLNPDRKYNLDNVERIIEAIVGVVK